MKKRVSCLCLALLLLLSLAACGKQAEERDSTPPTASVQPTIEPTPTPEPTPPIPYTDVPEDAPYYDAVVWAYESGIASDGDTFEPDSACTRGQVMTFLWRAMGSPEPQLTESPVTDIAPSNWFYKPVLWAYESGISTSSAFKPNNLCTNGEALTFLWRAEGKPIAAMHNSAIALAAPSQYFTRPVAWAETNGLLFAEVGFNPSAACLRADLMTYLYWAAEEWTFTEEDKTVQAEYERILNSEEPFTRYSGGLCYADYVDVDNDGKVELLTVETGENLAVSGWYAYDVTATVYANIDGHAGKLCEQTVSFYSGEDSLYICAYDSKVCLHVKEFAPGAGYYNDFYKIENGTFVVSDSVSEEFTFTERGNVFFSHGNAVSESEYNAIIEKYTNQKELFRYDSYGISVQNQGIAPSWEEYTKYWEKYWTAYWETSDPVYAAVLNGDFSAFAGSYINAISSWMGDITMDKNGVLTGDYVTSQKPISITVSENGIIHCSLVHKNTGEWDGDGPYYIAYYEIFPAGLGCESHYSSQSGEETSLDKSKMQLWYTAGYDGMSPGSSVYYKAP